jgi:hypothetical protein
MLASSRIGNVINNSTQKDFFVVWKVRFEDISLYLGIESWQWDHSGILLNTAHSSDAFYISFY